MKIIILMQSAMQCKKHPKHPYGFTLIELLISVTLSAILMTGIMIFVSSSLGSNMANKEAIEHDKENSAFEHKLGEKIGNITGSGVYASGSSFPGGYLTGIYLRTTRWLPVTFLGLKTATGYCDTYSGTANETGTIMKLAMRSFALPAVQNSTTYTLSSTGQTVFSGATRIVGTGYPGSTLDNSSGALTELSFPSALITFGTRIYIADTMNDRVLSYETLSWTITEILWPLNGLSRPTSLYFSGNILLIASSLNGKIYALTDGQSDGSVFKSNFQVGRNFSADSMRFTFSWIGAVTSPTLPWDFVFSGFTQSGSDSVSAGTSLFYSWTLQTFSTGTPYMISIKNIWPQPSLVGEYTATIDFLSNGIIQYSDVFHFFTKGDGSLETSTWNILETFAQGLAYPQNITGPSTWNSTIDWLNPLSGSLTGEEIISYRPIKNFSFSVTGNILTLKYLEYTFYDCILWKHRTEEHIKKIYLR